MTESPALLHDGRSAMPQQVWARLTPTGLMVLRHGAPPLEWPVATLRLVDRLAHEIRVAPPYSPERLVINDPAMMAAIQAALAPARQAARGRRLRGVLATLVAVPLLGAALWFGWPPLADGIARAIPASWEEPVGGAVIQSFTQGHAQCTAPEGMGALRRLVQQLATAAEMTDPPRVQVVDRPEINAFAAPGGHVVVFRGLLAQAASPDEVAGVLAHEFGHVRHRHGFRALVRASGVGLFASILLGGSDLGTVAVALTTLSYTRGFEEEADTFATDVLRRTGFGTEGLAAFFTRVERLTGGPQSGRGVWSYLQTHPHPGDRAERLMRAEGAAPRVPVMSSEDWAALRRICGTTQRGPKAP